MTAVRTYDPSQVVLTINGAIIGGFADGTFVSVEREEQSFTKVVGADGTVSRAKSNNKSGSMTITLKQTSPSNDVLNALLAQDELTADAVFPVLLKDNSGQTRIFSGTGWIQGAPTAEFAKEISNREWIIDLSAIEYNLSGNASIGGPEVA